MIKIKNLSMEYKLENSASKSIKDYLVKFLKGEIRYKYFKSIDNINLIIEKGEVIGIIGGNGAGKSTLLKIISGILKPTQGDVYTEGIIVPMLELGCGFDLELSGRENIFLNGAILGFDKNFLKQRYDEIIAFSELEEFIENPLRSYSSGMLMRLAFSIATIVNPEILIVDEILSVGDTHFVNKSSKKMKTLIQGGATVIMVSHSIETIRDMCSRVIWLEKGKVIMDGKPKLVCDEYMKSV